MGAESIKQGAAKRANKVETERAKELRVEKAIEMGKENRRKKRSDVKDDDVVDTVLTALKLQSRRPDWRYSC